MKQRWRNVVTTLYKVVSTLFQRQALKLYQRCTMVKILRWIMFHFQHRINVISTFIHNVETTLNRRWNVGWVHYFVLRMQMFEKCHSSNRQKKLMVAPFIKFYGKILVVFCIGTSYWLQLMKKKNRNIILRTFIFYSVSGATVKIRFPVYVITMLWSYIKKTLILALFSDVLAIYQFINERGFTWVLFF